jgi:hypothetical protein
MKENAGVRVIRGASAIRSTLPEEAVRVTTHVAARSLAAARQHAAACATHA